MGGNYFFKNIKKYHENQREKLILMVFFSNESLIHAPTLFTPEHASARQSTPVHAKARQCSPVHARAVHASARQRTP
jgi:hypothetical protein